MCIGTPARVLHSQALQARCEGRDGAVVVDLALVGPQPAGAWLLTFAGAAREVISESRARAIEAALAALEAALAGDLSGVDAAFADLAGEPRLPDHLGPEALP